MTKKNDKFGRGSGNINPVDKIVGEKIRASRKLANITQSQLADELGISFQQVQKYESGKNRLSASKLHAISLIVGVPIAAFFPDSDSSNLITNLEEQVSKLKELADSLSTGLENFQHVRK